MPKIPSRRVLPPNIRDQLSELYHRICNPTIRRKALDEFLTEKESRELIKGSGPKDLGVDSRISSKRILLVIAKRPGWTLERALLELTFSMDLIGHGRFRALLRAIGESIEAEPQVTASIDVTPPKPKWKPEDGKLYFHGRVIRKVRICRSPSNVHRLIEAFEMADWKTTIESPFGSGLAQNELHHLLHVVNRDLDCIRFHTRAGGREITWSNESHV
jgi:hypothetical protein